MGLLKFLGRTFAGTALLFSGFVGIGTSLVLLACSAIGYLPYSDRPGPGWWRGVHWPSLTEVQTYLGFAPWFAYFCLLFGLGFFALSLLLGYVASPRWMNRTVGGVLGASAATLTVTGAGWYFALAAIGPDAAAALGLLYGVFAFPLFVKSRAAPPAMWIRIGIGSCGVALFSWWIISPLLPQEVTSGVSYCLIRVTPGDTPVAPGWPETPLIAAEIKTLKLTGDPHSGISGGVGFGQNGQQIHVELIALEPIVKSSRLAIPRTGDELYVLRRGTWTAYPGITRKDGRTITVAPGTDTKYDGAQFTLTGEPKSEPFTWFPVIPKGK